MIVVTTKKYRGSTSLRSRTAVPYDYEVQYLECTGTTYINTGIKGSSNITVDFVCGYPTTAGDTSFGFIFGSRLNGNTGEYALIHSYIGNWRFGSNRSANWAPQSDQVLRFTNIENANNLKVYALDGSLIKTLTTSFVSFNNNRDLYLFALNGGDGLQIATGKIPIYTFKIYNSGTLVRDYIAVVSNGIGYFFDKVTNQLFGNAGTDNFIIGPRIPDLTKPWTQGTGNLYAAFNGQGNGTIDVWSDPNDLSQPRSMTLDVHTLDDTQHESILVRQLSA